MLTLNEAKKILNKENEEFTEKEVVLILEILKRLIEIDLAYRKTKRFK